MRNITMKFGHVPKTIHMTYGCFNAITTKRPTTRARRIQTMSGMMNDVMGGEPLSLGTAYDLDTSVEGIGLVVVTAAGYTPAMSVVVGSGSGAPWPVDTRT